MNVHTKEELKALQSLPLSTKITMSMQRILWWSEHWGEDYIYYSFSGGKDSTVLRDLVLQVLPRTEGVFVNTGLEYPEIQSFVKSFGGITILRPKMRFDEVIKKYGYPMISKEVSSCIPSARLAAASGNCNMRLQRLSGLKTDKDGNKSIYNLEKWKPLLNVDFLISDKCCDVMKKKSVHEYEKRTGKKGITAVMAIESRLRSQKWLQNGCNGFQLKHPKSNPMSFWTEQDVLQYIKDRRLPIASVYGDIVIIGRDGEEYANTLCDGCGKLSTTGCKRTGCIFCGFGAHLDKDEGRFVRLKRTHPRQYDYCMGGGAYDAADGYWKPNEKGLGMAHVIDGLCRIYGKNFIKY